MIEPVYLCDGIRTPFGRYKGGLSSIRTDDLAALPLQCLIGKHPQIALDIDEVMLGCANQSGEDNRNVARMTGLTYCGHPMSCAAGLAALNAYRDDNLINRSRFLGGRMFKELQAMQKRHRVIGDVRGGDGLFAVVELVADADSKCMHRPWPEQPEALTAMAAAGLARGYSFATRGNLIILAPPLVIENMELESALAALDDLLTEFFPD